MLHVFDITPQKQLETFNSIEKFAFWWVQYAEYIFSFSFLVGSACTAAMLEDAHDEVLGSYW